MIKKKLMNVGIIGLGVGAHHIKAFEKNKYTNITSICDFNKNTLKNFRKIYPNVKASLNSNDIFEDRSIELVSIASNDDYHFEHILQAIKYNKHIFVEKPICLNRIQLSKIVTLLNKKPNIKISSNMVLRVSPRFNLLKKMILKKSFKDIYYIESDYFWGRAHKLKGWRSKIDEYSIILGASIHLIDLTIWLLDKKPTHVLSVANRIGASSKMIKSETFSSINLFFDNGLIVKINAHGLCIHPHFHSLKLYSKNKSFIHQYDDSFIINENKANPIIDVNLPYPFKDNRHLIIDKFVDNVISEKNDLSLVTFKDICNSMAISFSAIQSVKLNKKVKIRYY